MHRSIPRGGFNRGTINGKSWADTEPLVVEQGKRSRLVFRREAQAFLASHPNEDLETALKALEIAQGSLHEVAERYE